MKEIKAFKCDHCSKIYQRKHNAKTHEQKCNKNPDNDRACFGCKFLEMIEELPVILTNSAGHEEIVSKGTFVCMKFRAGVYPPSVERNPILNGYDISDNDWGIEGNKAMPRECHDKEWHDWQIKDDCPYGDYQHQLSH